MCICVCVCVCTYMCVYLSHPTTAIIYSQSCRCALLCSSILTSSPVYFTRVVAVQADVYSFALVMWELFSKTLPFSEANLAALVYGVVKFNHRPDLPPNMPTVFRELVTQCWSPLPADRPSFDHIVKTLTKNPITKQDILREVELEDTDDEEGMFLRVLAPNF
jgi:hypothetical protein